MSEMPPIGAERDRTASRYLSIDGHVQEFAQDGNLR